MKSAEIDDDEIMSGTSNLDSRATVLFNWVVSIWSYWSDNVSDREIWTDAKAVLFWSLKYSLVPITEPVVLSILEEAKQLMYYRKIAERVLDKTRKDKVSKMPYRAFKYVLWTYLQELYGSKWKELPKTHLTA